jgi:hypothetical protein
MVWKLLLQYGSSQEVEFFLYADFLEGRGAVLRIRMGQDPDPN